VARRGLSVEFLGLPGAGKSGVSKRVAEILESQGHSVVDTNYELTHRRGARTRRLRKLGYILRELAFHPVYAARSARAIAATRQSTVSDLGGAVANWLFVSDLVRGGGRSRTIHLLDEGIFQALWSVGFGAASGDWPGVARAAGAGFPAPDVVVLVNASAETVLRRLRARGLKQSRIEDRLDTDGGVLATSERLLGQVRSVLVEMAKSGKNIHIHEVANERDADLEPNARIVAGALIPMVERLR
jgi:thymidylate kinase